MAAPDYLLTQYFVRIEAVGTRGTAVGDPADPLTLEVVVTASDNISDVIETVSNDPTRLRRARTGVWVFVLDEAKLQYGRSYTVHWRYTMTPSNRNVARSSFVWSPVPQVAMLETNTILFGRLADIQGLPIPGQKLVIETYADMGTLSHRTGQAPVYSDAFGLWHAEVPQGQLFRVVLGDQAKIVQAPKDQGQHALSELPSFQPRDVVRRDRYGYPVPGQDLHHILMRRLTEKEALAVLQSMSAVTFVSERVTDNTAVEDGVELYIHEQAAPSTVWIIQHGKNCTPVVSVLDADNNLMYPEVSYPDSDTVVLTFNASMIGKAVLVCGPEKPL